MDRTRDQVLRTHWTGRPLHRFEDVRLVTGQGRFVDDLCLPDMLHVEFARSNHARGLIVDLGIAQAAALPGVAAVLTGATLGPLGQAAVNRVLPDMRLLPFTVLPVSEIEAVGQPVAAVVAASASIAADAVALIGAEIEPLPLLEDAEPVYRHEYKAGDVGMAFANAAHVVSVTLDCQRLAPAALEPRAAMASWDEHAQLLHVFLSTQTPHRARSDIAAILGLPEERIRVTAPDVGGAFGGKASLYPEDALVALAAIRLKRPVKWRGSRSDDFLAASQGRGGTLHGELAVDADGTFLGLRARLDYPLGHWLPYSAAMPGKNAARCLPGPYVCNHVDIVLEGRAANTAAVGIYRGAGRPEAAMLMERLTDKAAFALGLDPAEIRRRNLIPADAFPYRMATGSVLDSGDYPRLLEKATEMAGYDDALRERDARRARGEICGVGVAVYTEPCGHGWESAEVRIDPDGSIVAATGSSAQGQGRVTAYAQIVADVLRTQPDRVAIAHGDTATCPPGIGALASRSTPIGGSALLRAAEQFREKARLCAARLLQAEPDHLALTESGFETAIPVRRTLSWCDLARMAQTDAEIAAEFGAGLRTHCVYEAEGEAWSSGCVIAQVAIDRDTGVLSVERIVWIDDAGTIVNPLLAEGQLIGGLAQGLGEATLERIVYDADGQLVTASFMDYAIPRAAHIPGLVLGKIETPSPFNAIGAKGIGEAGCVGVPAAIVNAAVDALRPFGVTHLNMPLTGEKLWSAMQNGPAQEGTKR
ncbi:xanthine dehydrogenase family protein molybdopterin-binding subunit [Pseudorhodoplanes sp.]|uniref:xanthine dehydrogenase family protein molybdopterin-binding subunit n=1 Tax=Pseudorhodoplanes sp. TaxID=1934341 RepID=UPI00391A983D